MLCSSSTGKLSIAEMTMLSTKNCFIIVLVKPSLTSVMIPASIASQKKIWIPISPTNKVTILLNNPRIGESFAKETEKKYSAPTTIMMIPSLFLSKTKVLLLLATFFFLLATLKILVRKNHCSPIVI